MDTDRALTDRVALFATGIVATYVAWTVFARERKPRRHIKVIVYHAPGNEYFEHLERGIAGACVDHDVTLDYVSLAPDIVELEETILDHLLMDHKAHAMVVRIPSKRVHSALEAKGVPYASLMSPHAASDDSKSLAVRVGHANVALGPRDAMLVDDAVGSRDGRENVFFVTPETALDVAMAERKRFDRLVVYGNRLARPSILGPLQVLGFRKTTVVEPDGLRDGRKVIDNLVRYMGQTG
jgi:hypothetical protein